MYNTNTYNDLAKKASSSHTHTFASLTSKPTTLSGYGITDAASSTTVNNININASLSDRTAITDLLTEADKLSSGRRIAVCDKNTSKTPYYYGLVTYTAGTAYINMSSSDYGQIIYFVSGNSDVYITWKTNGEWSLKWDKIKLIKDTGLSDGFITPNDILLKCANKTNGITSYSINKNSTNKVYFDVESSTASSYNTNYWKPVYAICLGTGNNAITCYYSGISSKQIYAEFRNFSSSDISDAYATFLVVLFPV
jgi:hypothetical protein